MIRSTAPMEAAPVEAAPGDRDGPAAPARSTWSERDADVGAAPPTTVDDEPWTGDVTARKVATALNASAVVAGRDLRWDELVELGRQLGPDPAFSDLSDAEVEERVKVQAAQLAAATCRWLQLLGELVVRGVWADQGARTPAQWLSYMIGLAPSTAREHVRVALRLRELPLVRDRFAAGSLSYSKVRAITRVALPEIEGMLVHWCEHATAADIERVVQGFRRYRRAVDEDPATRERTYGLQLRVEDGHTALVELRLPLDEALTLREELERLVELDDAAQPSEADAPAAGQRQLAVVGPVPSSVAEGTAEGAGSDASVPQAGLVVADGPVDPPPRTRPRRLAEVLCHAVRAAVDAGPIDTSGADRHTLVLHVDAEALLPGGEDDAASASAEAAPTPGSCVTAQTASGRRAALRGTALRRLACESGLVLVGRGDDGTPIDVGRRQRQLTTALRRAVTARDRSCRFPGCGTTRHLHVHHVQHWADGGPTDLANLVLVCGFHHRFAHEHAWTVRPTGVGTFAFVPPGGNAMPSAPRLPAVWPAEHRLAPPGDAAPDDLRTGVGYQPGAGDIDIAIAVLADELRRVLPDPVAA